MAARVVTAGLAVPGVDAWASLNDLVSAVLVQSEAMESLARDVWDVAPDGHQGRLQVAAEVLVDTVRELVVVRDRLVSPSRLAA